MIRLFPSVGKSLQLNCIVNELQLTEVIVNFEGKVLHTYIRERGVVLISALGAQSRKNM
jgi:hypothetical protein